MNSNRLNFNEYRNVLFDDFGNLKRVFEIARYEKYADETWRETDRFTTLGCSTFVIDNQIYFRCDDSLLPVNMDFGNKTCGACEQIIKEVPVSHKIIGNEILKKFVFYGERYFLKKQSYNNGESFYSFQDIYGNFNVEQGSHDLKKLINNLCTYYFDNESIKEELRSAIN